MAETQTTLINSDPIRPTLVSSVWGLWGFAVFWNAIAFPSCFVAWNDIQKINKTEDYLLLLILLFPLVGIFIAAQALKSTVLFLSYGKSRLNMNPCPGQVGGQVGGEIVLSKALPANARCEVRLECQQSQITRNSKGEKRTSTQVKWQDVLLVDAYDRSDTGNILFLFDVPAELPPTEPKSTDWHHWQVHIAADIPGIDLSLDFVIPVIAGSEKSTIVIPGREQRLQVQRAEQLIQALNVEQADDTIYMNSAYGREQAGSIFAGIFGGVFLAVGIGIGFMDTGASMMLPMKLIFCLVFGGIGLLILLVGIITPTTKLDTAIDSKAVHVKRLFLGWEVYRRSIPLASISGTEVHKNSSFSAGKRTNNWFQVRVFHNGKRQVIAESIPGRVLADAALNYLRNTSSLS